MTVSARRGPFHLAHLAHFQSQTDRFLERICIWSSSCRFFGGGGGVVWVRDLVAYVLLALELIRFEQKKR